MDRILPLTWVANNRSSFIHDEQSKASRAISSRQKANQGPVMGKKWQPEDIVDNNKKTRQKEGDKKEQKDLEILRAWGEKRFRRPELGSTLRAQAGRWGEVLTRNLTLRRNTE